ncbi:SARP family transcriptional regulator [Actinosynnema sp. ALI-1.44]|uniref:BTAD domain-containing putative transcriptional regulator n=1 Tax=Actinosynnema sp. ALI-1.44 TaxID=1933779 RepID=UPI00097CBB3B|nr:BTAD domain-containing putative transcriptional regulator [Actinosynnema sp. ALI-1.44]ONI85312.1 SARP family transcriptional regulator [Actinosynnema sp. ALI-1.44]
MGSSVRIGVLGPLVAADSAGPIDLKGPRHRAVLARLLVARGRVVPVDMLVADLWDDPPDGAVGAIQTFVAALRRALEPDRPPRAPATLLLTEGPGYRLKLEPDAVDAWRFEAALNGSLEALDETLGLWRGPAYAEFADQPWARAEIARLDELRLLAVERRAEALLGRGRAAEAVPDLQAHVDGHPLREEAWRLLALAQYTAGRQADALESMRRARRLLSDELGVDPGPALRELEADVLAHAPRLTPAPAGPVLVGRTEEMALLADAAQRVATTRRLGLALVSGEAGAGKTALAMALRARLESVGWTSRWSGNPEDAPSGWTHVLEPVEVDPSADPATTRFQLHQAARSQLASHGRLLVVLDDVHWADEETLALLAAVVADPIMAPVLIVATYRTTDAPTTLLGRVARSEPTRVYLGGLGVADVPAVVRAAVGLDVDEPTAAVIHRRSGGNPFFVRELARLLAAGGDLSTVPDGVRDVVRYRLSQLPADAQTALRTASVVGETFPLDVVGTLDVVEIAVRQGFLIETEADRFQFSHALVRDTLYQDLSQSRRTHLHREVGEALERLCPGETATLAHHFALAFDSRAVRYAQAAAASAERRSAFGEAARYWRIALRQETDVRQRLELTMGLVRALSFSGSLGESRVLRASALDLLDSVDDPLLTARVIASFDVPAIWTAHDDPALAARVVAVTERVLPEVDTVWRSRLLATIAMELRSSGGARAVQAAGEAEAIARELGEPPVLAFALNARFMQSFSRAGMAGQRVRIGTELVSLASRHGLVTFEVLGHLILMQSHSALADFAAADVHVDRATRLGVDYQLPLVDVFAQWYRALRASVAGQDATGLYRAAAAALADAQMPGFDRGLPAFALLCHEIHNGLPVDRDRDFGAFTPWCRPSGQIPDSPRDQLYEARTCLHAKAAIEANDVGTMRRLYDALLPAAGELAGAGSGMLTLGPVARYLGDLARGLDRPKVADSHYAQAEAVLRWA